MRSFIMTTVLSIAIGIALTCVAVTFGRGLPVSAEIAMLHLEDCRAPCWIGIVPGKTTFGEAKQRLRQVYGSVRFAFSAPTAHNFEITDKLGRFPVPFRVSFTAADDGPPGDDATVILITVELFGFSRSTLLDPFNFGALYPLIPHPEYIATTGYPSTFAVPVLVNERDLTQLLIGDFNPQLNCNPIQIDHKILRLEFYSEQSRRQAFLDSFKPWRGFRACSGK